MSVVVRFAPSPTGPLHIGGVRTALYNFLFARKHGGKFLLRIEDTDQTRFVPGAEEYIVEALAWCGITFDGGVHLPGDGVLYRQSDRMKAGIYREYADALVASGNAYFAFDTPEENEGYRKAAEAEGKTFSYGASTRVGLNNSLTLGEAETQARIAAGMPYVIRFKMPDNEDVSFVDLVREEVTFNTSQLDDKVLLKSDGMPTYHLANVVDDRLMAVTHVIRGEEWLQSTPLHVMLYRAFGWPAPQFVHLPLLLKPVGEGKLSKRDGDQLGFPVFPTFWENTETGETASGFRESGYLPEALINFLALLGWHPGDHEEIISMARMTQLFELERVSKSGAKFAIEKLRNFNQHYLKVKPMADLLPLVRPYAETAGYEVDDAYLAKAIGAMRERVTYVGDFVTTAPYLFTDPTAYDEKLMGKWTPEARNAILMVYKNLELHADWDNPEFYFKYKEYINEKIFQNDKEIADIDVFAKHLGYKKIYLDQFDSIWVPGWTHEALHHVFSEAILPLGIGAGKVMPALRLAISGVPGGPGVWEIAEVIGREATLRRIRKALEVLA